MTRNAARYHHSLNQLSPRLLILCALLLCASSLTGCGDDSSDDGGSTTEATTSGSTTTSDVELPSGCDVLAEYAGTYTVSGEATEPSERGESTRTHDRGTITIGSDCAVDFDTDLSFSTEDIMAIFDRTEQDFDRRVQVSYGEDDDGPVINVYLSDALEVTEIQYRHRTEEINVRAAIEP